MRAGEDLDRGRELVALDLGDRAREPVPDAGGGDLGALAARGEEPGNLRGRRPGAGRPRVRVVRSLPSRSQRRSVSTRTPSIEAASPIRYDSSAMGRESSGLCEFVARDSWRREAEPGEPRLDGEADVEDVALAHP